MATETEHKYLVNENLWKKEKPEARIVIRQGYIINEIDKNIRIRLANEKAYLTIKGKTNLASRPEFEYEIPINDAKILLDQFCKDVIEKTRHIIHYKGKKWEVDEFEGKNKGLIIAEIELASETETFELPPWATEKVTGDPKYYNSSLIKKPFSQW